MAALSYETCGHAWPFASRGMQQEPNSRIFEIPTARQRELAKEAGVQPAIDLLLSREKAPQKVGIRSCTKSHNWRDRNFPFR